MLAQLVLRKIRVLSTPACIISALLTSIVATQAAGLETDEKQNFTALEKSLSGVTLVGHFTDSNDDATTLKAERYELKSVRHVADNQWMFAVRIQYGENDVTLPLTLPVEWAGNTPVVSIDNFAIPGLGTYTARVMFFADHYAGFWSGADHGGHLFGIIKREKKEAAEAVPAKQ